MAIARTRITSRGQVSVPMEVRLRLGLAAGAVVEWETEGDHVTVRRSRRYSTADVRATLFPEGLATAVSLEELKDGLRRDVERRISRPGGD